VARRAKLFDFLELLAFWPREVMQKVQDDMIHSKSYPMTRGPINPREGGNSAAVPQYICHFDLFGSSSVGRSTEL
jgi:hypothetical protein